MEKDMSPLNNQNVKLKKLNRFILSNMPQSKIPKHIFKTTNQKNNRLHLLVFENSIDLFFHICDKEKNSTC